MTKLLSAAVAVLALAACSDHGDTISASPPLDRASFGFGNEDFVAYEVWLWSYDPADPVGTATFLVLADPLAARGTARAEVSLAPSSATVRHEIVLYVQGSSAPPSDVAVVQKGARPITWSAFVRAGLFEQVTVTEF